MNEILSGTTTHGGALLAPFGVAYVVGDQGNLPPDSRALLQEQVDLDLVPASGLVIFRNAAALPPAAAVEADDEVRTLVHSASPLDTEQLRFDDPVALHAVPDGWSGTARGPGLILLASEYEPVWTIEGSDAAPLRSFGWATSFDTEGGTVLVTHGGQLPRTIGLVLLGGFWLAALWITRKPVAR
jgi:hypothetical protein